MHLFRAQNPLAVDLFRDKIIEEVGMSKDIIADMIKQFMKEAPNTTLCLILLKEEKVLAFLFGFVPYLGKYFHIYQAWAEPEVGPTYWPRYMFSRILAFCDNVEVNEIRCETLRTSKALLRRWNFEKYSQILRYRIKAEIEAEIEEEEEDEERR